MPESSKLIWSTLSTCSRTWGILARNAVGLWSCRIFRSTRCARAVRSASPYSPRSIRSRITSRTMGRGQIVSRLPRGIWRTSDMALGTAVTIVLPRSTRRPSSSVCTSPDSAASGRKRASCVHVVQTTSRLVTANDVASFASVRSGRTSRPSRARPRGVACGAGKTTNRSQKVGSDGRGDEVATSTTLPSGPCTTSALVSRMVTSRRAPHVENASVPWSPPCTHSAPSGRSRPMVIESETASATWIAPGATRSTATRSGAHLARLPSTPYAMRQTCTSSRKSTAR